MILITGASDGLGHEIANVYKQAAKTVVNISRRSCSVADHNLLHDLSDPKEIETAANEVLALQEPLEAVINCVGAYTEEPLDRISNAEFDRIMAINVKSNILLMAALLDRIKADEADILSVISTTATKGNPAHSLYAASKWAQRGYTTSLQVALKDTASRVIVFCPGGIKTNFADKPETHSQGDDRTNWMEPKDLAVLVKQLLDLPKNIEVSEIIINRKSVA